MTFAIESLSATPSGIPQTPYELDWYACDLRTGAIIAELPSLTPSGTLSRRLGTHTQTSFELALSGAPADWEAATTPGRTLLVAVDRLTQIPLWPGIVLPREGGSSTVVQLDAVTPEAYLDRRFTGDQALLAQDQATVITSLMNAPLTSFGPPFTMDAPATGVQMDFSALDSDDRTVLSAMQELMSMDGGPEWLVDVAWSDSTHTAFTLPVRVRPKIGIQSTLPEAVFDFPGSVSDYRLRESYESGKGATVVLARGEGEGLARLSSAPQIASDLEAAGWPRWVHRYTPASGITDPDQLTAHAAAALALMRTGARVWTVEATASRAPRLGRDWGIGDSIRLAIERSPRHPQGVDLAARVWSWELDPGADMIRPILVEED